MIKFLRGLPHEAKRKVAAVVAGTLTVIIFCVWLLHSVGAFQKAYDGTREQGIAIFSFIDQNVEIAYNAFESIKSPTVVQISTTTATSTTATSTEQ